MKIAKAIGEKSMNYLLSVLKKNGFPVIQSAYEIYNEAIDKGKRIDNPPAYVTGVIKKILNGNEGSSGDL